MIMAAMTDYPKGTNSNSFVVAKVLIESYLDHIEQNLKRLD